MCSYPRFHQKVYDDFYDLHLGNDYPQSVIFAILRGQKKPEVNSSTDYVHRNDGQKKKESFRHSIILGILV